MLFNVDRRKYVVHCKALIDKDSVFVVVAFPCHKSDKDVLAQRYLALACGRTVRQNVACFYNVSAVYDGTLVNAGTGVCTGELGQGEFFNFTVVISDNDLCCGYVCYHTVF